MAQYLTHVKGEWAGNPFTLEPWQRDLVIHPLFGWKRANGTRKYRTAYIEVPRKNGKSTLAAGIALTLLFADNEPGAEVYSAAGDRKQAGIVFDVARQMVQRCDDLKTRAEVFRSSIVVPKTASSYHVLSADAYTKHGLNAHGVIFDELHAQPNRELWDVLTTSTGARRQPLIVALTTAGYDRHSICWELHEYAWRVRDGVSPDDSFLPVIFGAEKEDDWTSPKVWKKANPNLGVTIKVDYFDQKCTNAKEMPAAENTFKRLHLNIWTEQADRWIPIEKWNLCAGPVNENELRGALCFAGLDLSTTKDVTALNLTFPVNGRYKQLWRFWIPEETIAPRIRIKGVEYDRWVPEGFIKATEGNVVDYDVVRADINQLGEQFNIRQIAYDPWNATQIVTQLQGDGFEMVPVRQGYYTMSPASKEFEKLILGRKIDHGGNPVARWMMSNVAVEIDAAGNIKPSKKKSTEKIDGIVAAIMAVGRCALQQEEPEYDGSLLVV